MNIKVICDYCGFVEIRQIYGTPEKLYIHCAKCKDRNVHCKEHVYIDTYEGCPEFPREEF